MKAPLKAKLLVEFHWGHTHHIEHKSAYFFFHTTLIQQSVSDMKVLHWGESYTNIKNVGLLSDVLYTWSEQLARPDGHYWWPFDHQQWSGGCCVALKMTRVWSDGWESKHTKVKTLHVLKKRGICCNVRALYLGTMARSRNPRRQNVSMSKLCHGMISLTSVIESLQQWHNLIFILCASENLELLGKIWVIKVGQSCFNNVYIVM